MAEVVSYWTEILGRYVLLALVWNSVLLFSHPNTTKYASKNEHFSATKIECVSDMLLSRF